MTVRHVNEDEESQTTVESKTELDHVHVRRLEDKESVEEILPPKQYA